MGILVRMGRVTSAGVFFKAKTGCEQMVGVGGRGSTHLVDVLLFRLGHPALSLSLSIYVLERVSRRAMLPAVREALPRALSSALEI